MKFDRVALPIAALLAAVCLLQPTWPGTARRPDVVIVIDITQSMNVADQAWQGRLLPRIEAVRQTLGAVLNELPCGARLGWAVFTEYRSFLLTVPMEVCANRSDLRAVLARVDGRMAWTGNSEVAKGLNAALRLAGEVEGHPALLFLTDGQEAPPLSASRQPHFDGKPGEVAGAVVGVGGPVPLPIPKTDAAGRALGVWRADEVLQNDPFSRSRGGSVAGEALAGDDTALPGPGATPGREHLSSLRETYLQSLADERGLAYQRLDSPEALLRVLREARFQHEVPVQTDGRVWLATLALALLLLPDLWARARSRWRGPGRLPWGFRVPGRADSP